MPSRPLRRLLGVAVVLLAGVFAFLVTVNRTAIPGVAPSASHPPVVRVVAPSPTPSLDDVARAQLSRTVTIEALGSNDEGLGTGWLLDAKGDFVTNAHVVQGELSVRIRGRDGSSHVGDVVGIDRDLDVALIRSRGGFPGAPLTPFGGSLRDLPQPVVAIASGHATGHGDITDESVTRVQGDVPVTGDTTTGQAPTTTDYRDMLVLEGQAIYPGNSGGPVLDSTGRVVGIVTLASKSLPEGYAIQLNRVLGELLTFAGR
jgi:putative serine protease PepD